VPAEVVAEYAAILRLYNVTQITGDRYSSGWNADEWSRAGFRYLPSDRTKSEIYLAALPMLLSSQARLIDNEKMRQQFVGLERRVHPSGRESVDDSGAASANDDLANVCAGAMVLAAAPEFKPAMAVFGIYSGNVDNELGYCGQGEDNRSVYASQPPEYGPRAASFIRAIGSGGSTKASTNQENETWPQQIPPPSQAIAAMMAALNDELIAITDFTSACNAINGSGGVRGRYLARADAFVAAGHTGAALCQNVAALCDQCVARLAPVQDTVTGWTSIPLSSLKEVLR